MLVFVIKNRAGTSHEGKQTGKTSRKIRVINGFSIAGLWDLPCSPFPSCISLQSNREQQESGFLKYMNTEEIYL